VGGNAKGEVASAESVELVHSWVKRWRKTLNVHAGDPTPENSGLVRRLLESAVQSACYMVFGMGQLDPRQKGMSSTLSSLLISANTAFIAQVGDSRVYLSRDGKAAQLTEDHTLVNFRLKLGLITAEEAANSPGKNVITRAVGHQDYVEVDTIDLEVMRAIASCFAPTGCTATSSMGKSTNYFRVTEMLWPTDSSNSLTSAVAAITSPSSSATWSSKY
jgi:serine/threonine protein phosphatase PrpC